MGRQRRQATRRRRATGGALVALLAWTAAWAIAPASALAASTLAVPSAYATIQAAIDAAVDGDTVIVAPGTYIERIDFIGKNITVQSSAGRATTIIDGAGLGVVVKMVADPGETPTLRGFTVRNGADDGGIQTSGGPALIEDNLVTGNTTCGGGGGIEAAFSAATIRNNMISGNRQLGCSGGVGGGGVSIRGAGTVQLLGNVIENNQHGSWAGAISLFASGSAVIERNLVRNNSAGNAGGAIEIVNASPARIRNNLFTGNNAPKGGAIALSGTSGSSVDIANNTFVGNTAASGSAILTEGFAQSSAIYNNLIVGAGPGGVITCDGTYSPNGPQISYNDVVATSGTRFAGICAGLGSNLDAAPTFVNAATGDYHLAARSAGIDAGTGIAAGAPPDDIDGDARPIDGDGDGTAKVDIGFDEAPVPGPLAVAIDILPGTSPNVIKLQGKGLTIAVGLLSSPAFDARTAVISSLCFGDAGAPAQRDCSLSKSAVQKDLDRDGDIDLSLVFDTAQTGIDGGDTTACLTGRTVAGTLFQGCDAIVTR